MSRRGLNGHDTLHGLDAFRQSPIIKKGLLAGRVVADMRIASIIARIGVLRDEHLAVGEAMPKTIN